ncbi:MULTISPECIES: phage neck terminator protein [unclassified Paenibacillus]|uniref:phage neck terminator protein n=1 Tax=unclassified Paenibacillus TaxID=185978 RepID=UPI0030F559B9
MLPFKAIRSAIARGLKAALNIQVIEMSGGGKMPVGSFLTYDFRDGFGGAVGQPVITQHNSQQYRRETVTFTVSFNSYADATEDSIQNAMLARDWFKTAGRELLKNTLDVIVIEIGEVQNRDINIGEEWERRQGFDVDFRATDLVITDLSGWIETAPIQRSDYFVD